MNLEKNIDSYSTHEIKQMYDQGDVQKDKALLIVLKRLEGYINNIIWQKYPTYATNGGLEELQSIAKLTICDKMPEYNPDYALTTYFGKYIQGEMFAFISKEYHHVSKNDRSKSNTIKRAINELQTKNIKPTIDNIYRHINKPDTFSREVIFINLGVVENASNPISLDALPTDSFYSLQADKSYSPEQAMEEKERDETVEKAVNHLSELEGAVIHSLFYEENNLKQTALKCGISEAVCKNVKTKACLTLKASPILRKYLGLDEHSEDSADFKFLDDDPIDTSIKIEVQW